MGLHAAYTSDSGARTFAALTQKYRIHSQGMVRRFLSEQCSRALSGTPDCNKNHENHFLLAECIRLYVSQRLSRKARTLVESLLSAYRNYNARYGSFHLGAAT